MVKALHSSRLVARPGPSGGRAHIEGERLVCSHAKVVARISHPTDLEQTALCSALLSTYGGADGVTLMIPAVRNSVNCQEANRAEHLLCSSDKFFRLRG